MPWTDRQRAMLGAMGITLWTPAEAADAAVVAAPAADATPRAGIRGTAPSRDEAKSRAAAAMPSAAANAAAPAEGIPAPMTLADVSTLDWPALRERVAACRACRLCEGRTQTVFGVGHQQAHCMIVGEAPGENEDRLGEPFVGQAGQLLDRMLRAIGLTRGAAEPAQQVYIANTLKCRPPRNRNPELQELALCSGYLQRQIELVQPRLLLAMGRFAVQALLRNDEPIGRLRGRVHRWRDTPVVVTYHPAYLLRNPADKARAWADLCLAADQLQR
jgi:DNA polymerase